MFLGMAGLLEDMLCFIVRLLLFLPLPFSRALRTFPKYPMFGFYNLDTFRIVKSETNQNMCWV